MPKRVLIFSLVYYPRFIGGAEVAMKEITDRISGEEYEFDMITLRKHAGKFEKIGNVNVYRVGPEWYGKNTQSSKFFPFSKYLYIFLAFFKALALHRKKPYDFTWSLMANYAGFAALFFKLVHPRVPFLLTLQEGDPIQHIKKRVGLLYPLFKMIFTKADGIQAISTFLADWARSMGSNSSIRVIPNGVDIQKFKNADSKFKNEEIRKRLGIKQSDTILITTSRLVEKNGVEDIIKALVYLSDDVKLLVLGTGRLEDSLKLTAKRLSLNDRVFFLGFIPNQNLPSFLHASDIFVRPSLSEGMGNSFVEAMAAGLPVIATPVGGIPDFLIDEETGLYCKVKDPKSIAEKVEMLLKDPLLKKKIVENGRKLVEEKYDWEFLSGEMKSVFNNLM